MQIGPKPGGAVPCNAGYERVGDDRRDIDECVSSRQPVDSCLVAELIAREISLR
jgi:hypothetical protein